MRYVVKHQPPVVILENVSGAPWGTVAEKFAKNGYHAESVQYVLFRSKPEFALTVSLARLDTKYASLQQDATGN